MRESGLLEQIQESSFHTEKFDKLVRLFDEMKSQFSEHQFIGASMEGKNIYEHALPKPSVLVMGSESHGISDEIRKQLDYVCAIPAFGPTESLNVGVATAIFLHELKRP